MFDIVEAIHRALRIESTWSFVLLIALGSAAVGGILAWVVDTDYKKSPEYKASHPTLERINEQGLIQLAVNCDSVSLSMAYRGDVWALNTAVLPEPIGLFKVSAPPNTEAMWPEVHIGGFAYKCTVKNYGSQAAFAVSFALDVDVLEVIREKGGWHEGGIKKSRNVIADIPRPLSPQGIDEFSFFICSYDPEGSLEIKLPTVAFINSDDANKKQRVSLRWAGVMQGNRLSVPPKDPFSMRHSK